MRVAVFHNLPSGGAKRTLFEQVKRLSADCEIDVFTLSCAEHDFGDLRTLAKEHFTTPFFPLPLLRSPFGRVNQLLRLNDLARLSRVEKSIAARIDNQGYNVAYVHPCQYTNSPAALRFLGTPSVFYCQEPLRLVYDPPARPRDQNRPFLKQVLDRVDPLPAIYRSALAREDKRNLRAGNQVLVNSKFSRERFGQIYGVFPDVCYHGVDVELFRPLGLTRQRMVISVGALRPNKGFDFIIESLACIPASRRPLLVIVSNFQLPEERFYLEHLAQNMRVQLEIQLLVSDDELVKLYNQAMLTLYAPMWEPFGLAPLESLACGTPVVGVAEGGVQETVISGVTGMLVERDTASFAEAIHHLLNDHSQRELYGRQGRAHVMDFWTWDKAVRNLRKYLQSTAERPNGK